VKELRKMTKFFIGKYEAKRSWRELVERMEGNIYEWKDGRILLELIIDDFNVRL
jgi:hypothetical protein